MELKQVIIFRQDLNLPKGKAAAQAAHGAVEAAFRSEKTTVKKWRDQGQKKITLKVADLKELHRINEEAKSLGLITALITDAGKTVIAPGTTTVLAIGPDDEEKIDKVTGELKML